MEVSVVFIQFECWSRDSSKANCFANSIKKFPHRQAQLFLWAHGVLKCAWDDDDDDGTHISWCPCQKPPCPTHTSDGAVAHKALRVVKWDIKRPRLFRDTVIHDLLVLKNTMKQKRTKNSCNNVLHGFPCARNNKEMNDFHVDASDNWLLRHRKFAFMKSIRRSPHF